MTISDLIFEARKIVIKIGSNTLAKPDGTVNTDFMDDFAFQCVDLIAKSKQIVLVSSGAQVAGMSTLNRWTRKKDIHYRKALCAIGQVQLMHRWRTVFFKQGLHIGQLLLTKEDFNDSYRTLNMRNTLFTLVDEGVLPVINENDLKKHISIGSTNAFGTGGMETKLQAAERVTRCGIPMILTNGGTPRILEKLASGSAAATLFCV